MCKAFRYLFCFALFLVFSGCSNSNSGSGTSVNSQNGQLSLNLTDAATHGYKAIYVTIKEVKINISTTTESSSLQTSVYQSTAQPLVNNGNNGNASENQEEITSQDQASEDGTWQVVASPNQTYNLLELINGVMENLGASALPAGHYTQMRLILGETADNSTNINDENHPYANYLILDDNTDVELKVPSGYQSGIKLVHGFDILRDQTTDLILDFDASKSIVQAGNSGKWMLKPTIKVIGTASSTMVGGSIINDAQPSSALAGALVSIEKTDSNASDAKDKVIVETSTLTDAQGAYNLNLSAGTYTLVAYIEGYQPICDQLTVQTGVSQNLDYTLAQAGTGTLEGMVSIDGGTDEQEVVISIRMETTCQNASDMQKIEIVSINMAQGGSYSLNLPEGTYEVVAWADGYSTQTIQNIVISNGQALTQDISIQ